MEDAAGVAIRSAEEWTRFAAAVSGSVQLAGLMPKPHSFPVAVALPMPVVSVTHMTRWLCEKDWTPELRAVLEKNMTENAGFDTAGWAEKVYADMRVFVAERNASISADFMAWLEKRATECSPAGPDRT